jgi:hypothetical protein
MILICSQGGKSLLHWLGEGEISVVEKGMEKGGQRHKRQPSEISCLLLAIIFQWKLGKLSMVTGA